MPLNLDFKISLCEKRYVQFLIIDRQTNKLMDSYQVHFITWSPIGYKAVRKRVANKICIKFYLKISKLSSGQAGRAVEHIEKSIYWMVSNLNSGGRYFVHSYYYQSVQARVLTFPAISKIDMEIWFWFTNSTKRY